jgi:hypothetical protein
MKNALKNRRYLIVLLLLAVPHTAFSDGFSLFGVKMGMNRAEVDKLWTRMETGEYLIKDSILYNVQPLFDYRDRVYSLSFSMPIPFLDQYPSNYVKSAMQNEIIKLWKTDQSIMVGVRSGSSAVDVTITDKSLIEEFNNHINVQVQVQLSNVLKP